MNQEDTKRNQSAQPSRRLLNCLSLRLLLYYFDYFFISSTTSLSLRLLHSLFLFSLSHHLFSPYSLPLVLILFNFRPLYLLFLFFFSLPLSGFSFFLSNFLFDTSNFFFLSSEMVWFGLSGFSLLHSGCMAY